MNLNDFANDIPNAQNLLGKLNNNRWKTEFVNSEKIGKGGFASVYKAKHSFDDQIYAVKEVKVRLKEGKSKANFASDLQRMMDEAKFLARLNHQNILRYYNSWLEGTLKCKKVEVKSENYFEKDQATSKKDNKVSRGDYFKEDPVKATRNQSKNARDLIFEDTEPFCFEWSNDNSDDTAQTATQEKNNRKTSSSENLADFTHQFAKGTKRKNPQEGGQSKTKTSMEEIATQADSEQNDNKQKESLDKSLDNLILYIQTELCDGTLEDYLSDRNKVLQILKRKSSSDFDKAKKEYLKDALSFSKQILNGISYIHSFGIVHRDLKPSNIFVQDKTCKIGDFGLIKKLDSLYSLASSPAVIKAPTFGKTQSSQFKLKAAAVLNFDSSEEDVSSGPFKKLENEPGVAADDQEEFYMHVESPITKSVGTRTYASPEQWQADKENFDQRADIFSLGLIFLLLFHPMSTIMEQNLVMSESKKGKIPSELERELPEIAQIIKKMLSPNPSERPTLETVSQSLKLPLGVNADLTGTIKLKKENSPIWREKYFKLIEGTLYVFKNKEDKKAEHVYNLSQWRIFLKDFKVSVGNIVSEEECLSPLRNGQAPEEFIEKNPCISFESSLQLGCIIKAESSQHTIDLYRKCCKQEEL